MSEREIIVLDTADALYTRAAEEIAHIAGEAICTHGEFLLCLTGGRTPESTYQLLASRFQLSVDWKEVQFFWGDERCVPPDDPGSNFGMANRALLSHLNLKPGQIHRMRGEDEPGRAAQEYEEGLRRALRLSRDEFPRFDLTLLGLGANCHIASMFPGSPALHEQHRIAATVEVDDKYRNRITLTPPAINNSARVMFLVSGEEKAHAVKTVLEGEDNPEMVPAHIVKPDDGSVIWLLDRAAASQLSNR